MYYCGVGFDYPVDRVNIFIGESPPRVLAVLVKIRIRERSIHIRHHAGSDLSGFITSDARSLHWIVFPKKMGDMALFVYVNFLLYCITFSRTYSGARSGWNN